LRGAVLATVLAAFARLLLPPHPALAQHNTRFFIEILHNQKSNNVEWIIVFLIAFESGLMILDMSGVGVRAFDFLNNI